MYARYTILRDGDVVAAGKVSEVTTADLARFMVGHDIRTNTLQRAREITHEVLRVDRLTDAASFRDISFCINAGEILGVTGLLGDGRSELFLSIIGSGDDYSGQVYFEGKAVKVHSTAQALDLGIGYLPRNRKENLASSKI